MANDKAQATETHPDHSDCVSEAISQAYEDACSVRLRPLSGASSNDNEEAVASAITLIGDVNWSALIGIPASTALKMATRFAGFDVEFDSDDMIDTLGEFSNLFMQRLKGALDERGVQADLSTPTAFRVQNILSLIDETKPSKATCFKSTLGNIWTVVVPHQS